MPDARPLTFTEEARRRQIIDCTIGLIAEKGHAGASLSAIAASAGISKAAVLYHFTSKDNVVVAAFGHVLEGYVASVSEQVDAASDAEGMLVAYIRGSMGYLRDHPTHVRVLAEGLERSGVAEPGSPGAASRWQSVAAILTDGQRAGQFRPFDAKVLAIAIGGALDAVVAEWITDPAMDLDAAAAELETAVLAAIRS